MDFVGRENGERVKVWCVDEPLDLFREGFQIVKWTAREVFIEVVIGWTGKVCEEVFGVGLCKRAEGDAVG